MSGTELLLSWLPHAESFVLPGAGHLLHLENRSGFASGLADFLTRHGIGDASPFGGSVDSGNQLDPVRSGIVSSVGNSRRS